MKCGWDLLFRFRSSCALRKSGGSPRYGSAKSLTRSRASSVRRARRASRRWVDFDGTGRAGSVFSVFGFGLGGGAVVVEERGESLRGRRYSDEEEEEDVCFVRLFRRVLKSGIVVTAESTLR